MDRNNKSSSFNLLLKKKTRSGLGFSVKQRRTMPFVEVSYIMKGLTKHNLFSLISNNLETFNLFC